MKDLEQLLMNEADELFHFKKRQLKELQEFLEKLKIQLILSLKHNQLDNMMHFMKFQISQLMEFTNKHKDDLMRLMEQHELYYVEMMHEQRDELNSIIQGEEQQEYYSHILIQRQSKLCDLMKQQHKTLMVSTFQEQKNTLDVLVNTQKEFLEMIRIAVASD